MKTLCFLLCIAYASAYYIAHDEKPKSERIVQGDFAEIEEVPYQASLMWFNVVHHCGATIIDESWVITAAHCVEKKKRLSVRTGTKFRKMFGTVTKVEKTIMHPNYNTNTSENDIALIKLAEPLELTSEQKAIPIAKPTDVPKEGQLMKISGFGKVGENLSASTILKSAYVPVMNQENCAKAYVLDPITEGMFCAGDGKADSCQGDSGGPGVINGRLYGIISFGMRCGSKIHPGIYTRVHKYYDWIVETTGIQF